MEGFFFPGHNHLLWFCVKWIKQNSIEFNKVHGRLWAEVLEFHSEWDQLHYPWFQLSPVSVAHLIISCVLMIKVSAMSLCFHQDWINTGDRSFNKPKFTLFFSDILIMFRLWYPDDHCKEHCSFHLFHKHLCIVFHIILKHYRQSRL